MGLSNWGKIGLALLVSIILSANSGRGGESGTHRRHRSASKTAGPQSVPSSSLVLLLEGPFAIQAPDVPGKLRILIPRVKNHFQPGFDADLDQHLLCGGDYSIELMGHRPANTKWVPTQHDGQPIIIDTVQMGTGAPPPKYFISVLVDSPDELALTGPTQAVIEGGKGVNAVYSTKLLLRYLDIQSITVNKTDSGSSCAFGALPVGFPWSPSIVQFTNEGEIRLSLSMVPSKPDNSHADAEAAYKAIAQMLGINRTAHLPKYHPFYGPHNDCLSPMIRAVF